MIHTHERRRLAIPAAVVTFLIPGCSGSGSDVETSTRRALEAGDPQEAYRLATAFVADSPDSGVAQFLLGVSALRTLRFSTGAAAATRACELLPEDSRCHALRAELMQRRTFALEAREVAAEAVRLAPESVAARLVHGFTLLQQGTSGTRDLEGAAAAFRGALQRSPENPRARFGLAKALVLDERHEEGGRLLDELTEEGLEFAELRALRGIVRLRERDFRGAATEFGRAGRLGSTDPFVHQSRARALVRLGKREAARTQQARFEAACERRDRREALLRQHLFQSHDPNLLTQLAWTMMAEDQYEVAVPLLESFVADHPDDPGPRIQLSMAAERVGLRELAERAIADAVALAPDDVSANHAAARLAISRGDGRAAVSLAEAALEALPHDPEATIEESELLRALAEAHLVDGNLPEAQAALARLPGAERSSPPVQALRGRILAASGTVAEAERALTAALTMRPNQAAWLGDRGHVRLAAGNVSGALSDFRMALQLSPFSLEAARGVADALRAAGDPGASDADAVCREMEHRHDRIRELRAVVYRDPSDFDHAMELAAALTEVDLLEEAGRIRARAFEGWGPPL